MRTIQNYRFYSREQLRKLFTVEGVIFLLGFILSAFIILPKSNFSIPLLIGLTDAILFTLIASGSLYLMGLYRSYMNANIIDQFVRIFSAILVSVLILNSLFYWLSVIDLGRNVLLLSFCFSGCLLLVNRIFFVRATCNTAIKSRTIILGTGNKALQLKKSLDSVSDLQTNIMGYVHKIGDRERLSREVILNITLNAKINLKLKDEISKPVNNILDYCLDNKVDTIVVAVDDRRSNFPLAQLLECKQNGIAVLELMEFYERQLGRQQLDILDPSGIIYSNQPVLTKYEELNKDILDLGLASLSLLFTAPIIGILSCLIWLNSRSVFSKKIVTGRYNKDYLQYSFNCYKNNKLTLIGKFIKKSNLENLPVVFNIMKGEVSFVGPQPILSKYSQELSSLIWYYRQRLACKPGLISWGYEKIDFTDQDSSAEKTLKAKDQLQYDLFYIKKRSCLLDAVLLIKWLFRGQLSKKIARVEYKQDRSNPELDKSQTKAA
ncbi:MAG: sugar transferase [Gammaproteobacteria bacterium]|nr:sugar transferase [Gammaproteobacteria bacterium]